MNLGRYLFEVIRDMHVRWYVALVAVLSVMAYGGLAYLAFRDDQASTLPVVTECRPQAKDDWNCKTVEPWTQVSSNDTTCVKVAGTWDCRPKPGAGG